jgi:hypothetical protein
MNKLYVRMAADNDFIKTVIPFVKALADKVLLGAWDDITKEQIVSAFNAHAYSFFRMYQSCFVSDVDEQIIKPYLKIAVKDVMFGQLPPAQGWWLVSSISAPTIG